MELAHTKRPSTSSNLRGGFRKGGNLILRNGSNSRSNFKSHVIDRGAFETFTMFQKKAEEFAGEKMFERELWFRKRRSWQ